MENKEFREKCVQEGLRVARNYTLETTKKHLLIFYTGVV